MSKRKHAQLGDLVSSPQSGVSVNSEDRPHRAGEIGVLKTSAVNAGQFRPDENKAVLPDERGRVRVPVLKGSIIISRMNTPELVGASCYVDQNHDTLFLPDRLWRVLPKDGASTNMRWLSHVLLSDQFRRHVDTYATGTSGSMKNLSKANLLGFEFASPPQDHQSKIAEILDTLDSAVRETEAVVAKLKAMKQGLSHDLLTRGIDTNGDVRPPHTEAPHLYKETPLGWLPKGWDAPLLDNVAQRGSGHTPSKSIASYWNGGIKWVSLADSHRLDQVFISETDKEISEAGLANSSAVLHPENTVILSRDAGIGKSAILASEMAVSQHFMAWRCGARVNHLFLYYVLQRAKPKLEAIAMGSTIKTIGLPFFKKYSIALPPRPEQDRVAEILLEIERDIERHESELGKLFSLKSGLMDDLLSGRVSVTPLL